LQLPRGSSQSPLPCVAAIAIQDSRKDRLWSEHHDLKKESFIDIHLRPPRRLILLISQKLEKSFKSSSNKIDFEYILVLFFQKFNIFQPDLF